MLLTRTSLLAIEAASTDPTRENLRGLLVNDKVVCATDGHRLIEVSHTDAEEATFPWVDGNAGGDASNLVPCILSGDAAKDLLKDIPTKTKIPMLQHAQIDVTKTNSSNTLCVSTVDKNLTPSTKTPKKVDTQFPVYAQLFENTGPAQYTILFDPRVLGKTLITLSEMLDKKQSIKMTFFDPTRAVRIDGQNYETNQKIRAIVMPMREPKNQPVKTTKEN